MGEVLPKYYYGDPADVLEREQRSDAYREQRCLGCRNWDMTHQPDPCRLQLSPGRYWCKGFNER
ncbi:MAG: hypothetical protein KZQ94_10320 [Candidatus Thiodiazotropha sp. (ex Troendleina suluensis)]|nr:hypothetical protein [Candidatus Thiodiazotropha sp. (ex Troendleina suluensis)]